MDFKINKGTLTAVTLEKDETTVTVPEGVTDIGEFAFHGCRFLKEIHIPEGVTSIGNAAFHECVNLLEIHLPDSLKRIGESAFYTCSSLKEIHIPAGVTSIHESAFLRCEALAAIHVVPENPAFASADGVLFNKKMTRLLCYPLKKELTEYTVPDGVNSIGNDTFDNCENLRVIHLPDSVKKIGESAFHGCTNLSELHLPDSVTSIGDGAFYSCTSLAELRLPNSLRKIGESVFVDCGALSAIHAAPDHPAFASVDGVLFDKKMTKLIRYPSNKPLTEYTVPEGVTAICETAFERCPNLAEIRLPDGVTSIGTAAFEACEQLAKIFLPDSITCIGTAAFERCTSLAAIDIPDGVTGIGDNVFSSCESLENVRLPAGLTSIGESAFWGCTSLVKIDIPDGVKSIGDAVFDRCENLSEICIPAGIKKISGSVFGFSHNISVIRLRPDDPALQREYAASYALGEEIVQGLAMLRRHKYHADIDPTVKSVFLFLHWLHTHDEKLTAYIQEHLDDFMEKSIPAGEFFVMEEFAKADGFFTAENIGKYIDMAQECEQNEIFMFLLNYKKTHFGFDSTAKLHL